MGRAVREKEQHGLGYGGGSRVNGMKGQSPEAKQGCSKEVWLDPQTVHWHCPVAGTELNETRLWPQGVRGTMGEPGREPEGDTVWPVWWQAGTGRGS